MDRRSPPQKRTDDHAFPVRVKVLVPERGFENLLLDMHRWLDAAVGRGSYAVHGAGAGLTHATAWYFRTVEEAQAFVTKFPMLELADGTELPTYQSPNLPFGRGAEWSDPVCNLYSMLKSQEAMRRLFDGLIDRAGNMPPLPGIYPDYSAPIIRNGAEGRELVMARWGMPTPPQYLVGKKVDRGRDQHPADDLVALAGLARTRAPLPRALHQLRRERDAARRLAAAGLVRLRREPAARLLRRHLGDLDLGAEGQGRAGAAEFYGFLTSEPNAEVAAVHPKAMPVILTEPAEWETWLTRPGPRRRRCSGRCRTVRCDRGARRERGCTAGVGLTAHTSNRVGGRAVLREASH